tara:strand:- start:3658 stop:3906 length:249 start_codon:yes stop_codon:yes gene_type:complete
MTWKNHDPKVEKVWTKTPQEMLDYIIQNDKECFDNPSEQYKPSFYIGKDLAYIREVYEDYVGLETLTEDEQIENGYYRLEMA